MGPQINCDMNVIDNQIDAMEYIKVVNGRGLLQELSKIVGVKVDTLWRAMYSGPSKRVSRNIVQFFKDHPDDWEKELGRKSNKYGYEFHEMNLKVLHSYCISNRRRKVSCTIKCPFGNKLCLKYNGREPRLWTSTEIKIIAMGI